MTCQICGASLPDRAMFCGECGSSTTATPLSRQRSDSPAGDTSIIQPLPPQSAVFSIPYRMAVDSMSAVPVELPQAEPEAVPVSEPILDAVPESLPESAPEPAFVEPAFVEPAFVEPAQTPAVDAVPAVPATHFVLQFSTGEQVVVAGTGLLGRRPQAQADETFDHFVQIHDVSMSVSKSHLEFGQHNGEFWINDRMSGNGTVIRRHDDSVLRCEPGRRYLVARGSRIEIGDQFFILG